MLVVCREQIEGIGDLFDVNSDMLTEHIFCQFLFSGSGVFHRDEAIHFRNYLLLKVKD